MRVVLVNPPVNPEMTLGKIKGFSDVTKMHPIGLGYLATILYDNKIDVRVVDAYAESLGIDKTVSHILSLSPDIVGFSCVTTVIPMAGALAAKVKESDSQIITIFGGIHPTLRPDEILASNNVDIVVRGEGDITLLELVNSIHNQNDWRDIKGISYIRNDEVIHNPNRELISDLDALSFPKWDLFPLKLYSYPPHWVISPPLYPIMASRGCPFRCTFCSLKVMGRLHRIRSVRNVIAEIEQLISNYKASQIMFMDATFPMKKEWVMELCNELIARKINRKIIWGGETRINGVTLDMLKMMKAAGCQRLFFGIESGVQKLLNNVKKGFTLEQARETIKWCKEAGIETVGYFMLGLPGETKELSLQTIEFAKSLDLDFTKFGVTVPYPGTDLFDEALAEGTLTLTDWEKYTSFSTMTSFDPVYVPKEMTPEELRWVHKKAYRSFYFRPKTVWRQLLRIKSIGDIKQSGAGLWTLLRGVLTWERKRNTME